MIDAWKTEPGMEAGDLVDDIMKGTLRFHGSGAVSISTLEGTMVGEPGDWLIRGVKGEFYPCKPDIFEATYEPA